jgi:hypothetical protein
VLGAPGSAPTFRARLQLHAGLDRLTPLLARHADHGAARLHAGILGRADQAEGPFRPSLPSPFKDAPHPASSQADRGNLLDAVLLDIFASIVLVLEPSCHSTAPRPGLTGRSVAVPWFHASRAILLLLLIAPLMYRVPENLTLQISDIVRRDGDQLPTAFSRIAQEVKIVLSPLMLVERELPIALLAS